MTTWPKDNQAARNAFYGDPGKGQIPAQMVPVVPPFRMTYTDEHGTKVMKSIMFHRKAAPALLAALNEIWDHCQHDQAKVDASGASKYFGAYNHRMVRGSTTKWSNHAYAAAIDLNALDNALGVKKGTMPDFIVDAFCRQGAMWGGWYKSRPDWMHFEFVDNGGRKPKSMPPCIKPAKPAALIADDAPADEFEDHPALPSFLNKKDDPVIVDGDVKGDPELYSVQRRLKAMNYSPGVLDGVWGGGTSGALSGFINDRGGHILVPASLDAFNDVREAIKGELGRAESETPRFTRPVSPARKAGDAKTVAAVAPEVVPAKRNFLAAVWAAILAAFGSIWDTISGWFMEAWNFFTDHKDDLPEDSGGLLSTAWEYVKHIPTPVWWLAAAGLFVFLALNARSSVKKITESVQSGVRL
ncbi:M15 family metallopeptidase [uncultured Bradyrhizobium sp.]|uniref:M15 family metallopeptidase n=1 Tax=uncultured Bradyrhizobium sp. TaxID=199684 RepID=UPI0035C9CE2F